MKKISMVVALFLLLFGGLRAGVIKKTRSEINFKSFGQFHLTSEEKITPDRSFSQSQSEFKGQGIVGGLAAKTLLRSGDFGEIIDLQAKLIYQLDNKKKEYTVSPLEKLKAQEIGEVEKEESGKKPEESEIKILRSEFKVEPTGEEKMINQFNCQKFSITWLAEWENTRTGVKGQDLLTTEVWTTPYVGVIDQAQQEEMKFSSGYMKALGFELKSKEKEMLGETWMNLLSQLKPDEERPRLEEKNMAKELQKIKGYPVVISGQFFSTQEGGEAEEKPTSPRGLVGGLAKSVLKKKSKEGEKKEPVMTYYFELLSLSVASLTETDFQIPTGYKKKG